MSELAHGCVPAASRRTPPSPGGAMADYSHLIGLVEALHRLLFDSIKDELDRKGNSEINSVQALLLYKIGSNTYTIGELRRLGCFHGSNVTYSVKHLANANFIIYSKVTNDRRSALVSLTSKGWQVHAAMDQLFERQSRNIEGLGVLGRDQLETVNHSLSGIRSFLVDHIRFRL